MTYSHIKYGHTKLHRTPMDWLKHVILDPMSTPWKEAYLRDFLLHPAFLLLALPLGTVPYTDALHLQDINLLA